MVEEQRALTPTSQWVQCYKEKLYYEWGETIHISIDGSQVPWYMAVTPWLLS